MFRRKKIIDEKYLNDFSDSLMLASFAEWEELMRESLKALEIAVRENNINSAGGLAHKLRSRSGSVGCVSLTEIFRDLEDRYKSKNLSVKEIYLDKIWQAFEEALFELKRYINKRKIG